jgi:hypothetical protein
MADTLAEPRTTTPAKAGIFLPKRRGIDPNELTGLSGYLQEARDITADLRSSRDTIPAGHNVRDIRPSLRGAQELALREAIGGVATAIRELGHELRISTTPFMAIRQVVLDQFGQPVSEDDRTEEGRILTRLSIPTDRIRYAEGLLFPEKPGTTLYNPILDIKVALDEPAEPGTANAPPPTPTDRTAWFSIALLQTKMELVKPS